MSQLNSQQAQDHLNLGQYASAIALYEQIIEADPETIQHYWQLGLAYLLSGQETEAQMIWTMVLAEASEDRIEQWSAELIQILNYEANHKQELQQYYVSWVIRKHIHQLDSSNYNNLLHTILISEKIEEVEIEQVVEALAASQIASSLQTIVTEANVSNSQLPSNLDANLLLQTVEFVLHRGYQYKVVYEFVQAAAHYLTRTAVDREVIIQTILSEAFHIGYVLRDHVTASRYCEIGLTLNQNHLDVLATLSYFYVLDLKYEKAIQMAKRLYRLCQTPYEKVKGGAAVLRCLTRAGGHWQEAYQWSERQKELLNAWLDDCEADDSIEVEPDILTGIAFYLPYFADRPRQTRHLINRISEAASKSLEFRLKQAHGSNRQQLFPLRPIDRHLRSLKLALMSCTLSRHSIGWLARWFLHHLDRDRFEPHVYFMQQSEIGSFSQKWYANKAVKSACFHGDPLVLAQAIYADEIDILIDLDSLTFDDGCSVLLHKPAPVQVTWLGWDASGLPTIDYYLADTYVLPEDAQDYYSEKIWRLPSTYLAVDGFEVGVPTLRRDLLEIPNEAVVYFSSQTGQKRNPDNIRTQLRILKQVPNSYFLIKGFAAGDQVKALFQQLAAEEGVSFDRLRFLPPTPDEETHRANLAIADVVLDTFPYNGATTTMETLWMGIPLVTKVGEQFAARNSYGMMMNAGIEEGIAWSDEEYVEWGVRLGKDAALRQEISQRLKQARQTAPLFNAKQFTRDMEAAFEQMWQIYLEQH